MNDFQIFSDSCCDLAPEQLKAWDVPCANMTFTFEGEDREYICGDLSNKDFYDRMRQGAQPKTAAVNASTFADVFEPALKAGRDVLYVAFSSGLSTTINSAHMAAQDLKEVYPNRTVRIVDTLSASVGGGMMVALAVRKQQEGASLEETAAYIEGLVQNQCVWFTVDDLEYLKRGGRISPTAAMVGGLLGIKPVLSIDPEGRLVKVTTVRGRKKSIEMLADKFGELSNGQNHGPIYIAHADCPEDAQTLADLLKSRYGVEPDLVGEIGPVIGSHAGPGTLGVLFLGEGR